MIAWDDKASKIGTIHQCRDLRSQYARVLVRVEEIAGNDDAACLQVCGPVDEPGEDIHAVGLALFQVKIGGMKEFHAIGTCR